MATKTQANLESAQTMTGQKTLVSPILQTGTVSADPVVALGVASKQYVDTLTASVISQSSNAIINGNMEVWQRGASFAVVPGSYTADRFRWGSAGAGLVTVNRSTTVPSVASAGILFNYSLEVDVTTADASIAAGDFYNVSTRIEGYNWRHFAQRQFTLSFWVSSTKTGIHCIAFRNNGSGTPDRCYIAEYTVNVADTPEYKTITVSASPSAGTWDYINGCGLEIVWNLAAGSTFQTTAGTWSVGNFYGTANQVNVMDSNANFFRVTGVRLDIGGLAIPIQYRAFQDELNLCKRYYQKSFGYTLAPGQNLGQTNSFFFQAGKAGATSQNSPSCKIQVSMRISPTIVTYNPQAANAQIRDISFGADTSGIGVSGYEDSLLFICTGNASTAVGNLLSIHWTADAEL